jgi:hypothetical protein
LRYCRYPLRGITAAKKVPKICARIARNMVETRMNS